MCFQCLGHLPHPFLHLDKIKDMLIAKIAMQCSDLYADAYSSMQVGTVKAIWEKVSYSTHTHFKTKTSLEVCVVEKTLPLYTLTTFSIVKWMMGSPCPQEVAV